jgi:DNA gyrase/topoisomerase IV subunit B
MSKYVKLDHREHVLKRSETYVGSKTTEETEMYVIENNDLSNIKVIKRVVKHNPAFIKLFDEILTNASDHYIRTGKVKMIKVSIDDKKISVENDGPTIPIELHKEEGVWNAELIFSHLLTGENYDDSEVRTVGGRNGLGAKLCNIFSTKFIVECCDGKKKYKQVVKDNMSSIENPTITDISDDTKPYTKITYYPDYSQFDFDSLTEDLRSIMYKRCLDVATYIPNVRISVDGKTLPIKKISDFMEMHLPEGAEFFYEKLDNGWDVGVAKSTTHGFEQVSIVNSITTYRGGTHVNHVSLNISKAISDKIKRKDLSWVDVKNKLFLFLVCQVPNSTFDTQTKECLTNRMTVDIHKNCDLKENTIKKIIKSEIGQSILDEIDLKEKMALKRMSGVKKTKVKLDKLVDANKAGTQNSDKCNLFLCEGDSATTTAISGMAIVGRDYYGAFPLKGKVLNVRGTSTAKIKANKEIQNLVDILGLQFGEKYTDTSKLRYGKCVLMTDSDCIEENTEILLNDGSTKKIKNLKNGDIVKSHSGDNKVIGIRETVKDSYIELTIEGNIFQFGENHKIPVYDTIKKEIVIKKVKDISKEDLIIKLEKNYVSIENIEIKSGEKFFYDIEVENDNTFYISKDNNNYLVHNCDGIHIKGLLMNFFETFWPELLKMDFLYEFITPIIKAKKGKEVISFYTLKNYKEWLESQPIGWTVKYYKGLGTSTPQEAKEYFKEIDKHLLPFLWDTDDNTDKIDMVFNDTRVSDRKEWILESKPITVQKYETPTPISSFIDNEMITFSISDNIRSIPNIYDGLKPSQRKILYTCLSENINKEFPVSSLGGLVKTKTKYNHGEQSLEQGIISMSQNFLGSNNLNLLVPEGQFGSRIHGGKDAASPRYINTYLSSYTKDIFKEIDNDILTILEDDGKKIEPYVYKPIIPMVLINGADGIGSGWSTYIPKYSTKDIINFLENKINGKKNSKLTPKYNGFIGEIVKKEDGNYSTRGLFERINSNYFRITELPIGTWTQNYVGFLDKLLEDKVIKDYDDNSTEDKIDFKINVNRESMEGWTDEDIISKFKLETSVHLSNMNLFVDDKIVKFDSPEAIIDVFYQKRLEDYEKRKEIVLDKTKNNCIRLENIVKFIKLVISNKIIINNKKKDQIESQLIEQNIIKIEDSFNYLLNMSIYSLTKEKIDELENSLKEKKEELKELKSTAPSKLWLDDLEILKTKLKK